MGIGIKCLNKEMVDKEILKERISTVNSNIELIQDEVEMAADMLSDIKDHLETLERVMGDLEGDVDDLRIKDENEDVR